MSNGVHHLLRRYIEVQYFFYLKNLPMCVDILFIIISLSNPYSFVCICTRHAYTQVSLCGVNMRTSETYSCLMLSTYQGIVVFEWWSVSKLCTCVHVHDRCIFHAPDYSNSNKFVPVMVTSRSPEFGKFLENFLLGSCFPYC